MFELVFLLFLSFLFWVEAKLQVNQCNSPVTSLNFHYLKIQLWYFFVNLHHFVVLSGEAIKQVHETMTSQYQKKPQHQCYLLPPLYIGYVKIKMGIQRCLFQTVQCLHIPSFLIYLIIIRYWSKVPSDTSCRMYIATGASMVSLSEADLGLLQHPRWSAL